MPAKKKKQPKSKSKKLVTKAEFARICGVKAPNLTPMYKNKLKDILTNNRIDLNHPKAINYMKRRGIDPTKIKREKVRGVGRGSISKRMVVPEKKQAKKSKKKSKTKLDPETEDFLNDIPDDIRKVAHLSLIEIVRIFGTDVRLSDWLASVKKIEDIAEKQLKNQTARGQLISREFVRTRIFDLIETSYTRLLSDSPRTIVARLNELFESGETKEAQELIVRDIISTQIKGIKTKTIKSLQKA